VDLTTILLPVMLTAALAGILSGLFALARCRNDDKPQGRRAALLLIVVALGLAGAVVWQLAPVTLEAFTSKEGGFTVLLPGTPEHREQQIKGTVVSNAFACESRLRGYTFLVGYVDMTEELKRTTPEAFLDRASESLRKQWDGPLLEKSSVTLEGGFPGRAMRLEAASGRIVTMRVYLVKQRMFQLIAVVERRNQDLVPRVLDSFKLTGP
jgi:hypothetical protein